MYSFDKPKPVDGATCADCRSADVRVGCIVLECEHDNHDPYCWDCGSADVAFDDDEEADDEADSPWRPGDGYAEAP